MRVTGSWSKIPAKEYEKLYYVNEQSKETYLEWSRKFNDATDSFGFMRHASSKFTTLQEALKSGVAMVSKLDPWSHTPIHSQAYIFKGDDQIGTVDAVDKSKPYSAIYTSGKTRMYLNKDGSEYKGVMTDKKLIQATTKIDPFLGKSYAGASFRATNLNDLRRQIYQEYVGRLNRVDYIVVSVGGKHLAKIQPHGIDTWGWWEIHKTSQEFNVRTGALIKE